MTTASVWPALANSAAELLGTVEHGIWGRAPGARADFRWLARSRGFRAAGPRLASALSLGPEDRPAPALLWRAFEGRHYAVHVYPSSVRDAAGRAGALEKQILEWSDAADVAPARVAFALLAHVQSLGSSLWSARQEGADWSDPEYWIPLEPIDLGAVHAQWGELEERIDRGIAELMNAADRATLFDLYDRLLSGSSAVLRQGESLPALALAALLLPLPRAQSDRLSIAGFAPSTRADRAALAARWDVVATDLPLRAAAPASAHGERAAALVDALERRDPAAIPAQPAGDDDEELLLVDLVVEPPPAPAPDSRSAAAARSAEVVLRASAARTPQLEAELAAQLAQTAEPAFATEPPRRAAPWPRARLALELPDASAAPVLRRIHEFVCDVRRRALDSGELRPWIPEGGVRAADAARVARWAAALEANRPDYADAEQWQYKVQLVRALAYALAPADETAPRGAGSRPAPLPADARISALFFASLMHPARQRELRTAPSPEAVDLLRAASQFPRSAQGDARLFLGDL